MLKNDGVRQWEGWHPIYYMENNPFMFETTNQVMCVASYSHYKKSHISNGDESKPWQPT